MSVRHLQSGLARVTVGSDISDYAGLTLPQGGTYARVVTIVILM